ncbi:tetratricopeptide repeat protein, partial [Streptomyces sp. HSW2009]
MGNRAPNEKLQRLVRQAEWTYEQLARKVNQVATERGTKRSYSSQAAWLWVKKGVVPRDQASRSLVVEALARGLGRSLTCADAGFPEPEDSSHARTGT